VVNVYLLKTWYIKGAHDTGTSVTKTDWADKTTKVCIHFMTHPSQMNFMHNKYRLTKTGRKCKIVNPTTAKINTENHRKNYS